LIYLDRNDVPNRAGSGLFYILYRSSYLNFKKCCYFHYIRFEAADPGIVTVEGFFALFDLTSLNPSKKAGNSRWNPLPRVDFLSLSWEFLAENPFLRWIPRL
jgi:hypothetical protein